MTPRFLLLLTSCVALLLPTGLLRAQPAALSVTGAVQTSLTLSPADLAQWSRATVSTTSNGISTTYEGVWLHELLTKAGLVFGARARGASLSSYVIATADDGYQVVFSLGEIDPGITDGKFLVADKANGQPLFGENGSFRLVIPNDKRGARSVRMLKSIRVVAVPQS